MKNDYKKHPLRTIQRAGVPLAAFETADPAATIQDCVAALNGKGDEQPVIKWDCVVGAVGLNKTGQSYVNSLNLDPLLPLDQVLAAFAKQPEEDAICFSLNMHRFISNDAVMQAVWNLRDSWKAVGATLVMLCPAMTLPIELQHDVMVITEPLPDVEQVGQVLDSCIESANENLDTPIKLSVADRAKAVDTALGVSAFAAETAFSTSLTKDGIDKDALWERKRKMVEQTPGLSVWRDRITFDDVGGLSNIKTFLTKLLMSGKSPVRCIGFIDEVEKMFAGSTGGALDGGVSQDQLMVFLREMQDANIPGIIFVGPPGTGKSLIAKCAATICDGETLAIDTGAMKGGIVGSSESMIRKALATFKAVSQGKGLFVATCNKIATLPPELRRRFRLGTFYVDLPSVDERKVIWKIKTKRYEITDKAIPEDDGWTGAEIEACCDIAFRTGMSLKESSNFIVPVCKSAADQIETLRRMATGRFISASAPGIYDMNTNGTQTSETKTGRKVNVN